ncbi:MAG TPA: hypothetical protein DCZ40_05810 [Lachnospiraceae bacterium]|nr:hypothetical protein [Lachnospiraceae bacterium]
MKRDRKKFIIRVTAACAAIAFAIPFGMPLGAYAKENTKEVQRIHHVHIGNPSEGGACYEKEIKHVHGGNDKEGGGCFLTPVYHVHDGDEKEGGECYRTELHHTHEGTEKDGKGCYGLPVYHKHTGSTGTKGGCYGSPVYHKHTGNSSTGGGCYGKPVYHFHTGSASAGGGCYGKAVHHSHTGSASAGGGCYTKPVYHSHNGNETSGGKCYEPVKHKHISSCYQEGECVLKYIGNLQKEREENGYCYHHGEANIVHFRASYQHMSCGAGVEELGHSTCWTCQNMDFSHNYNQIICGKDENTVEGYRRICGKETSTVESWELGCGKNSSSIERYEVNCGKNGSTIDSYQRNCNKNESTVDSYQRNCGKTESDIEKYSLNCGKTEKNIDGYARSCTKNEETIDGYCLSCGKTEETVEGYALSCTKDEDNCYADFSVWSQDSGWTGSDVVLQASVQDKKEFLQLCAEPFRWEGKAIAPMSGDTAKAAENGIYYVYLNAENEDVDKNQLFLSIEVKNIDRTAPFIEGIDNLKKEGGKGRFLLVRAKDLQPDKSPGSGMAAKAYSFDGGKTWQKSNTMELKRNGRVSVAVRDCCGNVSMQEVEILNAEEEKNDDSSSGDGNKEDGNKEDGNKEDGNKEDGNKEDGNKEDGKDEKKKAEDEKGESNEDGKGEDGNTGKEEDTGNRQENESAGSSQVNSDSKESQGDGGLGDGKLLKNEKSVEKQRTEKKPLQKKNGVSGGRRTDNGNIKGSGEENKIKNKEKKETADGNKTENPQKREVIFPGKEKSYQKEAVQSEMPRTASEPENGRSSVRMLRRGAVEKTVKAVTFTVGSIVLVSGLIYLVYLVCRSIQVYDCDGEGKARYVGSCIMKKTEEGFEVRLPNMIWEHSATGQYSLRPGRMFAKKHRGKELMVIAGEHKEAVWIDKEMPLRLTIHV